jgi:hypothetical protein
VLWLGNSPDFECYLALDEKGRKQKKSPSTNKEQLRKEIKCWKSILGVANSVNTMLRDAPELEGETHSIGSSKYM